MRVKNRLSTTATTGRTAHALARSRARERAELVARDEKRRAMDRDDGCKVFIETKDGKVSETPAPEPGLLAGETSTPWFMGNSGAVTSEPMAVGESSRSPDGPWSSRRIRRTGWSGSPCSGTRTWSVPSAPIAGSAGSDPGANVLLVGPRTTTLRCAAPSRRHALSAPAAGGYIPRDLVVVLGRERGRDSRLIPWTRSRPR